MMNTLEPHALLRIEHLCLSRSHPEQRRIESIHIRKHPPRVHARRPSGACGRLDLAGLEERDALESGSKILPKLVDGVGPRQTRCHADDRDAVIVDRALLTGLGVLCATFLDGLERP